MNAGFLEIINHGQEEKIRLLQNKVDLYSANLEQYKQKSYNETQVSFFNYSVGMCLMKMVCLNI